MLDRSARVTPNNPKMNSDTIAREFLDTFGFEERLFGAAEPDIHMTLFGTRITSPIMTAAISGFGRITEDGLQKMVSAVRTVGTMLWMGVSTDEEVAQAAAAGIPVIEIIKPYADQQKVVSKIEAAKRAGCIAVGMDIDHAFDTAGKFDVFHGVDPETAPTIDSIREYVRVAEGLPFIVKGVLSTADAAAAAGAGAKGIVISHHHNIFPGAVAPLQLLPDIRRQVGEEMTILADGMLYDGYDAYKALLLGADGVLVGRPLTAALAKSGSQGVTDYLSEMNAQLCHIMARTGARDVAHLDPSVLHKVR